MAAAEAATSQAQEAAAAAWERASAAEQAKIELSLQLAELASAAAEHDVDRLHRWVPSSVQL